MAKKKQNKIKVKQVRSTIGQQPKHRKTLEAFGFRKVGHTRELVDTPQIRGMIEKVHHLIEWEEVE